ncbi:MAG: hypothetical protein IPI81_14515 [Flavobacteriales bacterium]|nr:hypothetical protein [Flavobacteriales bacterium]MCC6937852.1 hypothetical protein [Flavobacteriales bacterium]
MRWLIFALLVVRCSLAFAQADTTRVPNSTNGWYLSPHGTIRILLLFVEIEYDQSPSRDPQPNGSENWPKHQLPKWKDEVFDPQPAAAYFAQVTRYYHDMSLGRYTVLGDYIDTILTLRESEYPTVGNAHGIGVLAVKEANKMGTLRTHHHLSIADFDLWNRGGRPGMPKHLGADDPHSYDHVMVITRNSGLTHNQGSVDQGSPGKLFGYESDSQSRFGGMYAMPYEILQHEYNHLLFGGNNFHVGGGNAAQFSSYFPFLQGGWSMMGGSNSSLLTGNAWDRDRLGWRAADASLRIHARSSNGTEVNSDIDPYNGDTGVFVLRDFMTTGDAVRIRLPFLPENEYAQWIWLENHQTYKRNGILSDIFHYEQIMPCVSGIVPGIHAYLQVDRDNRYGTDIYGQHSDYLRPIPANGNFDLEVRTTTETFECLWPGPTTPFDVSTSRDANPLTGQQDLELPLRTGGEGKLNRSTHMVPRIEYRDGKKVDQGQFYGHSRQVFTPTGVRKLGMTTNPSSANMLTLLNQGGNAMNRYGPPDNRVVHLNGIAVELLEQRANGDIAMRVRNDDRRIEHNLRWCADSIVLHPSSYHDRTALTIASGARLTLDRSRTPTQLQRVGGTDNKPWYSAPTRFVIAGGATVVGERNCELELTNESVIHVMPGARLDLHTKAKVNVQSGSRIIVHAGGELNARAKVLRKLRKQGRVVELSQ